LPLRPELSSPLDPVVLALIENNNLDVPSRTDSQHQFRAEVQQPADLVRFNGNDKGPPSCRATLMRTWRWSAAADPPFKDSSTSAPAVDNVNSRAGGLDTVLEELAGETLVDWAVAERTVFSSFLPKTIARRDPYQEQLMGRDFSHLLPLICPICLASLQ